MMDQLPAISYYHRLCLETFHATLAPISLNARNVLTRFPRTCSTRLCIVEQH